MAIGPPSYVSVAAFTFQVWEQLICLAEDVRWVYCKPLTLHKLNFAFNRYAPLVVQAVLLRQRILGQFSFSVIFSCRWWTHLRLFSLWIFMATAQITPISRVIALYNHNKYVLYGLRLLYAAELTCFTAAEIYFFYILDSIETVCVISTDLPPLRWCIFMIVFPAFFLDFVTLCLTFYKLYRYAGGPHSEPILRLVLRDSFWTFLMLWITILIGLVYLLLNQVVQLLEVVDWLVAIMSWTSCQLFLDMAHLGARMGRPTAQSQETISATRASITADIPLELGAFTQFRTLEHPSSRVVWNEFTESSS